MLMNEGEKQATNSSAESKVLYGTEKHWLSTWLRAVSSSGKETDLLWKLVGSVQMRVFLRNPGGLWGKSKGLHLGLIYGDEEHLRGT
ncbi:uncharacterized [Tachysurus ichikawai]